MKLHGIKKLLVATFLHAFSGSLLHGQDDSIAHYENLIKFTAPIGTEVSSLDSRNKRMLDTLNNPDGYVFEEYSKYEDELIVAIKKGNHFKIYKIDNAGGETTKFKRIDFKGYGTKELLIFETYSNQRFARGGGGGFEEHDQDFIMIDLDTVREIYYSFYRTNTTWEGNKISETECFNVIPTFNIREVILANSGKCNDFDEDIENKNKVPQKVRYILTLDGLKLMQ